MGNKQSNQDKEQLDTIDEFESLKKQQPIQQQQAVPTNQIYYQESEGQIHQTFGARDSNFQQFSQEQASHYIPSNDEFINQTYYDDVQSDYQCTCQGQYCECCQPYYDESDLRESQSTIQQCLPSGSNYATSENLVGDGIRKKMPLSKVNFLIQNKQDSSMLTIQEMDEDEIENNIKPQQNYNQKSGQSQTKVNNRYKSSIILSEESGENNYQKFTFNINHKKSPRSSSQTSQHCYQCLKTNIARSFQKQQSESVIEYEISEQGQKDNQNPPSTKIKQSQQLHKMPLNSEINNFDPSSTPVLPHLKKLKNESVNNKIQNPYQAQFQPKIKAKEYFEQVMVEDEIDHGESPTLFDYRFMFCKLKNEYESKQINKKPSYLDQGDSVLPESDLDQFIKESIVQMVHDQFGEPQVEELKTPEKDETNIISKDRTTFETPSSTQDVSDKNNVVKFKKWKEIRDSKQQSSYNLKQSSYDLQQIKEDLKNTNDLKNRPKKVETQNDNPLLSDFDSTYKSHDGFGSSKMDVNSSCNLNSPQSTQKKLNNVKRPQKHSFYSPSLQKRDSHMKQHKRVSDLDKDFLKLDHYDEPVNINGKERHIVMQSNNQMIIYSQDPFLTPSQLNPKDKEYLKLLMDYSHIEQVNPKSEILYILDFNHIGTMVQKEIIGDNTMKLSVKSNQDPQLEVLAIKFQFYSKDVCQEWDSFISSILDMMKQDQSITYLKLGNLLLSQVQFWLYPSMHEQDFLNKVDTGDILLFRSKVAIGNWIQRKITGSHFDHVCMILRYGESNNDIYIFEAVGRDGVRILKWEAVSFCIGSAIDKVCFRKLHMLDNKEINITQLRDLNLFRKITHGSQYGLSTTKLMTRQSVINNDSNASCTIMSQKTDNKQLIDLDKSRKYFCSELVAKAHKILGIFKNEQVSCTQYFPGCYDKDQNIDKNLKDDVLFGPPINILVDNTGGYSQDSVIEGQSSVYASQEFDQYKELNEQLE